jgi:hypothetical protein
MPHFAQQNDCIASCSLANSARDLLDKARFPDGVSNGAKFERGSLSSKEVEEPVFIFLE